MLFTICWFSQIFSEKPLIEVHIPCFTCKQGINQMHFEGKISSLRSTLLFVVLHKFNENYLWEQCQICIQKKFMLDFGKLSLGYLKSKKKKIKSNEYQLLSNLQTMQCTCNSVQLKQRISVLKRSNFKNTRLKTKLCSSEDSTSLYNHQF